MNWDLIESEAKKSEGFKYFIDPDDQVFLNPTNMIEAIQQYCEQTNQGTPEGIGEISRTIFESLALRYKKAIINLEEIIGKKLKVLHVIGGGSRNELPGRG